MFSCFLSHLHLNGLHCVVCFRLLQGSCQVLKQLQAVTARLDTRRYIVPEDDIFNLPHTGTAARGRHMVTADL